MLSNFTKLVSSPISHSSKYLFSTAASVGWTHNISLFNVNEATSVTLENHLESIKDRKIKELEESGLPYSFNGTKSFAPVSRAFDQLVLDPTRVDINKVHSNINGIINKYYEALTNGKGDIPASESNFLLKTKKALFTLKNSGFKLELKRNDALFTKKNLKESLNIFETMHIMGLNVERFLNAPIENYVVNRSDERKGLLQYTLKKQEDGNETESDALIQKEITDAIKHGKIPVFPFQQVILRVYVQYTSPFQVVATQNGKEVPQKEENTFSHVAILENQLRLPPVGSTKYLAFNDRIKAYRLDKWRLVDFDGALQGNSHLVSADKHKELVMLA